MGVLAEILAAKQEDVRELRKRSLPPPPPRRPVRLTRGPGEPLWLIAEIKRRSPSAGALSTRLSVGERAAAYERAGAAMVSVLCDARFFDGSYAHLAEARGAVALPLLCKEFVIDEVQLDAARAFGASLVLLIVRCLDDQKLAELAQAARDRDLVPLFEVADSAELARALTLGADHIGVNARDLDTLAMDAGRAETVLAEMPESVVRGHFSGIKTAASVDELRRGPADLALIGECLMRQDDPSALLSSFAQAARGALQ